MSEERMVTEMQTNSMAGPESMLAGRLAIEMQTSSIPFQVAASVQSAPQNNGNGHTVTRFSTWQKLCDASERHSLCIHKILWSFIVFALGSLNILIHQRPPESVLSKRRDLRVFTCFWCVGLLFTICGNHLRGVFIPYGMVAFTVFQATIGYTRGRRVIEIVMYCLLIATIVCSAIPWKVRPVALLSSGSLLVLAATTVAVVCMRDCDLSFSVTARQTFSLACVFLDLIVEMEACNEMRRWLDGLAAPSGDGILLMSTVSLVVSLIFSVMTFHNYHAMATVLPDTSKYGHEAGKMSYHNGYYNGGCTPVCFVTFAAMLLIAALNFVRQVVLTREIERRAKDLFSSVCTLRLGPSSAVDAWRPDLREVLHALCSEGACISFCATLRTARDWWGCWRVRHKFYLVSATYAFVTLALNLMLRDIENESLFMLAVAPKTAGLAACSCSLMSVLNALLSLLRDSGRSPLPYQDINFRISSVLKSATIVLKLMATLGMNLYRSDNCPPEFQLTMRLCVRESQSWYKQVLHRMLITSTVFALLVQTVFTFKGKIAPQTQKRISSKLQCPRLMLLAYFLLWSISKVGLAVLAIGTAHGPQFMVPSTSFQDCWYTYGSRLCLPHFHGKLPSAAFFDSYFQWALVLAFVMPLLNELSRFTENDVRFSAVLSVDGVLSQVPVALFLAVTGAFSEINRLRDSETLEYMSWEMPVSMLANLLLIPALLFLLLALRQVDTNTTVLASMTPHQHIRDMHVDALS